MHRALGVPSPTRRNQVLHLALRGVRRSAHTGQRPRQPLTTPVLRAVLRGVTTSRALHRQDKRMLKAALLLGFYGFLRVSEFTAPSQRRFNPRLHPTSANICLATDMSYVDFYLKRSKTDQYAEGVTIRIGATCNELCPVAALSTYLAARRSSQQRHTSPLFCFHAGQPLTRPKLLRTLQSMLSKAGYDPTRFNTHSLRIGAASSAALAGLPLSTIKHLGRWRSSCYTTYIRRHPAVVQQAATAISQVH